MRASVRGTCVCSPLAVFVALLATLPHASGQGPTPRDLVSRAINAVGGEQALRNLTSISADFVSVTYGIGQEETPDSPARLTVLSGHSDIDHRGSRRLLRQEARPGAGPTGITRTRQVVAGGAGFTDVNGAQSPLAAAAVAGVDRTMRLQPERLLLLAQDNAARLRPMPPRPWQRETLDGFRLVTERDTLSLYFDRLSGLLTLALAVTDDPILGDRLSATAYWRWTPTGDVRLPRQIDVTVNTRTQSQLFTSAASTNTPLHDSLFAIPDSLLARARAAAAAPAPPVVVNLVELAPGVWRAEGGSHHSLVIEGTNALVVIEAPQNAQRSRAVLDTLRSRFPGKRVSQVVNTHHHWDHSGGLREYMARGIPVVTHMRNVGFVRGIAAAPRTLAPDALSRIPRTPATVAVRDSLVLGSGANRVVLYSLPTTHAEGLLAAYLPMHRLLFTSDVVTPGPTLPQIGSAELVAFARARRLAVERFAGGHGGVAGWPDLERAAGR